MSLPDLTIELLLPHRDPFLFVDRIVSYEDGRSIRCAYCVPVDHPFLVRSSGSPVFPPSLLIEALGQTAALCIRLGRSSQVFGSHPPGFLVRVDQCTFQEPVLATEEVLLAATLVATYGPLHKFHATARNGERLAAAAAITLHVEV